MGCECGKSQCLTGRLDGQIYRGYSAYEIAVQNGYGGTEEEWLASLKGENSYQLAVLEGYTGTLEEWIASLKGEKGDPGYTPQRGVDYWTDADRTAMHDEIMEDVQQTGVRAVLG